MSQRPLKQIHAFSREWYIWEHTSSQSVYRHERDKCLSITDGTSCITRIALDDGTYSNLGGGPKVSKTLSNHNTSFLCSHPRKIFFPSFKTTCWVQIGPSFVVPRLDCESCQEKFRSRSNLSQANSSLRLSARCQLLYLNVRVFFYITSDAACFLELWMLRLVCRMVV